MTNPNTSHFEPSIEHRLAELMEVSELFGDFMGVQRATYREGRLETDGEHTLHIMFLAVVYTAKYHPEFDPLEVAGLLMVHDLDEVYVGDVNSLTASDEAMAAKELAEAQSRQLLRYKFGDQPYMLALFERYWLQEEPIVQYARGLDKLDPSFAHLRDGGQAIRAMEGIHNPTILCAMNERSQERMAHYATSDVVAMRRALSERVIEQTFPV